MICPFCRSRLKIIVLSARINQSCYSDVCLIDEVSSYEVNFEKYPTRLDSRCFRIGKFYVEINYKNNKTIISRLEVCFLMDSIEIPYILQVDFKKPQEILAKVQLLMLLS